MTQRRFRIAVLFLLALFAVSCAPRGAANMPPAFERRWPVAERVFRHAVTVEISGQPSVSFDGLMRYGPGPVIRVVCLGALGMTLCDMTITPKTRDTHFLHPALNRIPDVEAQMALCLRSVWFASLAPAAHGEGGAKEAYDGTLLEHNVSGGQRTVTACGPERFWTVRSDAASPPRDILFTCERPEYAVRIRFISQQTKEGGTP